MDHFSQRNGEEEDRTIDSSVLHASTGLGDAGRLLGIVRAMVARNHRNRAIYKMEYSESE